MTTGPGRFEYQLFLSGEWAVRRTTSMFVLVLLGLLWAGGVLPAFAQGGQPAQNAQHAPLSGIIDRANLLSTVERTTLRQRLAPLAERFRTDLFVVTIDDTIEPWVSEKAHRYMVTRAFKELDDTRQGVERTARKLTILVLFKRNAIVHLESSAQEMGTLLLATRFYSGFDAATFKVRSGSHGAAAIAYVDGLDRHTRTVSDADVALLRAFWDVAKPVLKVVFVWSREVWTTLDGFDQGSPFRLLAVSQVDLLDWVARRGIVALVALGILFAFIGYAIKRIVGRLVGQRLPRTAVAALKATVVALFLSPVLTFLMTIASYDVENILFLHERFNMPLPVLLERAKDAVAFDFHMTWLLAAVAALALGALELFALKREGERAAQGDDGDGEHEHLTPLKVLGKIFVAILMSLGLVILPGAAATILFVYFIVERLIRIWFAWPAVPSSSKSIPLQPQRPSS